MLNEKEIKNKVIQELHLEGLDTKLQDEVIVEVTQALMERAMIAVLEIAPKEHLVEIIKNAQTDKEKEQKLKELAESLPNVDQVVQNAMKDGLQAYKDKFHELASRG